MQRWWVSWPIAAAAVITLVNVELILIPLLVGVGVTGLTLFAITSVASAAEVTYWYWFAGWIGRQASFIPVVQSTVSDFTGQGLTGLVRAQFARVHMLMLEIWNWFVGHVQSQMQASSPIPRWLLACALDIIRTSPIWMMYPLMIGLGLCPLGWIPGILICRKHRVRGAFTTLLVLNAIKTYGIGLGWTALLDVVRQLFA